MTNATSKYNDSKNKHVKKNYYKLFYVYTRNKQLVIK